MNNDLHALVKRLRKKARDCHSKGGLSIKREDYHQGRGDAYQAAADALEQVLKNQCPTT